jgi:hypothetical protein
MTAVAPRLAPDHDIHANKTPVQVVSALTFANGEVQIRETTIGGARAVI